MNKDQFTARDIITVPTKGGLYQVITNAYWTCLDKEGKEALFYTPNSRVNAPQCNHNESISNNREKDYDFEVNTVFVERAFIKTSVRELTD